MVICKGYVVMCKYQLGGKVKVNSRSVYGARGRVNIEFFLTDPTPSEKRLSV